MTEVKRNMRKEMERRRSARLIISSQLSDPGVAEQLVRLVDLSSGGARIEHLNPLRNREVCFFSLPRALGGIRLQGQVAWSRVMGRKPGTQEGRQIYYQSGLTFILLTPEQQAGVTAALERLKASSEASPAE